MNRRFLIKTVCMLGLTVLAGSPALSEQQLRTSIVETSSGSVQGMVKGEIDNFFGIPYAAPPVGDLRWQPPKPVTSWSGVKDTVEYGAACPQSDSLDSKRVENEDCLFLNVQRPLSTTVKSNLPVLVFIHGGGWTGGSGNIENLNKLVRDNDIIGVAINYRLGTLGYLAHPALKDDNGDTGNYGFMDQQAALRWVQANIANFGGDPAKVTIGGESAGGGSVCVHLTAPGSKDLFSRAIMQSTLCGATARAEAEATGLEIATKLGCAGSGADAAACLRKKAVSQFLDLPVVARGRTSGTQFLPEQPYDVIKNGKQALVPVLIGSQRNEGRSYITDWKTTSAPTYDQKSYEDFVRVRFKENADAVLSVYPWPDDPTRYSGTYLVAALEAAGTGGGFGQCPTNNIAEGLANKVPTFEYEFSHSQGPGWFNIPGYIWGDGHATELAYLIPDRGNFAFNASAFGNDERQLADQMVKYWGAFIKSGVPSVDGQPAWGQYKNGKGPILVLNSGGHIGSISPAAYRSSHHCDFWDSLN